MSEGEFSVVKSNLPFVAIGIDHAGEQENKYIKGHGGLTGIANNVNARNRFLISAPVITNTDRGTNRQQDRGTNMIKRHHNLYPSQSEKQIQRVESVRRAQ